MQSRYYDPEICRFISADNLELIPTLSGTAGQLNLYAYCNNNPVMYSDPTGEIAITTAILIGMGIGAAIGLGVGLGLGLSNGARGLELAGYIVGGIASGIIAGGIIAASIFTGGTAISAGLELFNSGLGALALAGGGTVGGAAALVGAGVMAAGGVIVVGGTAVGINILQAVIAGSGDISIECRYPSNREHGNPVHLHAANEGNPTKIGPNGKPLNGQPELSPAQKKVIDKNLDIIKKYFKKAQRWMRQQPW